MADLAVLDMVPFWVKKRMDQPEWVSLLSEEELNIEVRPDAILWQLRIRLWKLVESRLQLQASGQEIEVIKPYDIYREICTSAMWSTRIRDETKGWFVCRPIHDFSSQLDALLTIGTARLWEVLQMPFHKTNKSGDEIIDHQTVKNVMAAFKLIKETKYGGPVQKVVTAKVKADEVLTPDLVTEEIKALEAELKDGKVVDVGAN